MDAAAVASRGPTACRDCWLMKHWLRNALLIVTWRARARHVREAHGCAPLQLAPPSPRLSSYVDVVSFLAEMRQDSHLRQRTLLTLVHYQRAQLHAVITAPLLAVAETGPSRT